MDPVPPHKPLAYSERLTIGWRHGVRLFEGGKTFATAGIGERFGDIDLSWALEAHYSGYWGTVCEEDWNTNNEALANGTRLMSVFPTRDRSGWLTDIWVITDADRAVTTILLPEEY